MKMDTPKFIKILNKGVIAAVIVSALSFFITLVPCQRESGIGICRLPNPFQDLPANLPKYYFSSTNPLTGLVMQFILILLIFIAIFMFFRKKSRKVLDLTEKR